VSPQDEVHLQAISKSIDAMYHSVSAESQRLLQSLKHVIQALFTAPPLDEHDDEPEHTFPIALEELAATNPPHIRVHGMFILKDLFQGKQLSTTEQQQAQDSLVDALHDEDSYVHLNAIKTLVQLVDQHNVALLVSLAQLYSSPTTTLDVQLRAGQVLFTVFEHHAAALQTYLPSVLPHLMQVLDTTQQVELVHSALSILGCACEQNAHALGQYVPAILQWITHAIQLNPHAEVRRASVVLFVSLLHNLGTELHQIASDALRELVSTLDYAYTFDTDDLVRQHIDTARQLVAPFAWVDDHPLKF
jgi:hypothetical protein